MLAGASTLTVDASDIRATTRRSTYGLILEDISHSVDGGIYAELVRNRTFKESYQPGSGPGAGAVPYWSLRHRRRRDRHLRHRPGPAAEHGDRPVAAGARRRPCPRGGRVAASNLGYYGIAVNPATTYRGSLWARASTGWSGRGPGQPGEARRHGAGQPRGSPRARRRLGQARVHAAHPGRDRGVDRQPPRGVAAQRLPAGRLRRIAEQDVWLSVVSLFPPTYKNRPNGLRPDLAQKFAALKPGLLRVPGGNYLEGVTLETRFDWKATLGPIEQRAGHQNTAWGYWSTDGMGLLEYLRMAEDIGAQPLLAAVRRLHAQRPARAGGGVRAVHRRTRSTRSSTPSATPPRPGEPGGRPTVTRRRSTCSTSRWATRTGSTARAATPGGSRGCTTPSRRGTRS